jgi:hypothetical protein
MDKEKFIEICNKVHNNKYDYSFLEQNDIKTRDIIKIKCEEHGEFKQKAWTHKTGGGCRKCHNESISKKIGNGLDLFIKKSKEVHGDRYDYSEVDYINNNTPVKIKCKEHCIFYQTPRTHIFRKSGCVKCKRVTKDDIVNRSIKLHNNKYKYSNFEYNDENTVNDIIKVECPIHGEFTQIIKSHLSGAGCPYCRESRGEKFIESIFIKNGLIKGVDYIRQYKFKDCKNKLPLPFDFFLPKINVCVEYDGDQHNRIVSFFGGFKEYEKRKINDKIKDDFCLKNNINLTRISGLNYKEIEKTLIKIITI